MKYSKQIQKQTTKQAVKELPQMIKLNVNGRYLYSIDRKQAKQVVISLFDNKTKQNCSLVVNIPQNKESFNIDVRDKHTKKPLSSSWCMAVSTRG